MSSIIVKSEQLNLPPAIAKKLRNKDLELLEVEEGFLLRPIEDSIKKGRGILKGKQFSTERYFQMKKEEKEIER